MAANANRPESFALWPAIFLTREGWGRYFVDAVIGMHIIIGMLPHIIIIGMPIAIIEDIASQRSFMRAIIEASVGIIFIIMPSFVISQDILHIIGIIAPFIGIIIGIIMPFIIGMGIGIICMPFMPFIMPFIIGIMPFMPFIMPFIIGIMPFIGMGIGIGIMCMPFMPFMPFIPFMGIMLFIGIALMESSFWLSVIGIIETFCERAFITCRTLVRDAWSWVEKCSPRCAFLCRNGHASSASRGDSRGDSRACSRFARSPS